MLNAAMERFTDAMMTKRTYSKKGRNSAPAAGATTTAATRDSTPILMFVRGPAALMRPSSSGVTGPEM
jgi:hypothetical protein